MSGNSSGGFLNFAYHDSETLEMDKRFPIKTHHTNPYEMGAGADSLSSSNARDGGVGSAPRAGWQDEGRRWGESIPMNPISNQRGSPSWQHNHSHTTLQISADSQSVRLPSSLSGNMSMRWRGNTMTRMSILPGAEPPPPLAPTEDALQKEMETEEQNRVKELADMSTRERTQAIRDLPMSFEEKKAIRNQVLALKSANQSRDFTCFRDFTEDVSVTLRRWGYSLRSARQALQLWHGTMKEIGGRFGTSVLTYFLFLKWLLVFNIVSFLINFGFITIPVLVHDHSLNVPAGVTFRGLELLTGAGYFNYTVMYYGSYSNETLAGGAGYDMRLSYFFTISIYMVLCGLALIFSMARSFQKNYMLASPGSNSAWQLLSSWDFSITNERAVTQRKNNLSVQLKESLSEGAQMEKLTLSEKMKHFGVHLGFWFLSTGLAFGCGAGIYFLCQYEQQKTTDSSWTPLQEAETLLVPFMVSLMNLVVPLIYSVLSKFEVYSSQSAQIYTLIARNVLFKMSILGILCYYWMHVVAKKFSCWESMVGQALYRLVFFDFLFLLLGSFFGEFLSNLMGRTLVPSLGVPEFDVARNVFELIYAQTLTWIGIYFSPLLPVIQILKYFILFYVKKVSLAQNCQPPRRTGRAAQMRTILTALLFFPSFVGALSIVAYTAWSLTPSRQCGPFRGLNNTFAAVGVWIDDLQDIPGSQGAIWIYHNIIRSEVFYFFLALIVIIIIYIFWQVTQGRKQLIVHLRQQIINEGKDKSFLLDKLQNLHKLNPGAKKKHPIKRTNQGPAGGQSNFAARPLLSQHAFVEEEEGQSSTEGVPVPADIPTSSALLQAMIARQRAEEGEADVRRMPDAPPSSSSAVALAMQARRAELTRERDDGYSSADSRSDQPSALAQALLARRMAEEGSSSSRSDVMTQVMRARRMAEESSSPSSSDVMTQVMMARRMAEESSSPSRSDVMTQVMRARRMAEESSSPSSSDVMTQVMQARRRAEASLQSPAPAEPSAMIQAMLARQQAQNEFDDGY